MISLGATEAAAVGFPPYTNRGGTKYPKMNAFWLMVFLLESEANDLIFAFCFSNLSHSKVLTLSQIS